MSLQRQTGPGRCSCARWYLCKRALQYLFECQRASYGAMCVHVEFLMHFYRVWFRPFQSALAARNQRRTGARPFERLLGRAVPWMVLICSDKDTASASDGDDTLPLPLEFADFDLRSPKPFGIGLDRFNMFCLWHAEFAAASPWSEAFSSPLSCNEEPAPRRIQVPQRPEPSYRRGKSFSTLKDLRQIQRRRRDREQYEKKVRSENLYIKYHGTNSD